MKTFITPVAATGVTGTAGGGSALFSASVMTGVGFE